MSNFSFITNMESCYTGGVEALTSIEKETGILSESVIIQQITDSELWNKSWELLFEKNDFVLFAWMGTGLGCDFLKKASSFMHKKNIPHLFHVLDPGNDVLELGITEDEKANILQYFAFGGLENFKNLYKWIFTRFCKLQCSWNPPKKLPWYGIYHPQLQDSGISLPEYLKRYCKSGHPTVGLIFSREDWLWEHLDYQRAIIETLENHDCNVLAVFTSTLANPQTGSV